MCGICCYIGYDDGFDIALKGLKLLLNRGYDSCGCAGLSDDDKLIVHKYAETKENNIITLLKAHESEFIGCKTVISHSRWCVCGGKTDANAHPHNDYLNRISLVHNGIIENYHELKQELEKQYGIQFRSQTDTEVIVNLISVYYDQNGKNMAEAIMQATQRLEGTWALAILCIDNPNNLYCARHGSPLLIGFGENFAMLASEQSGFAGYCKNYVCLNNGDVIVIEKKMAPLISKQNIYMK